MTNTCINSSKIIFLINAKAGLSKMYVLFMNINFIFSNMEIILFAFYACTCNKSGDETRKTNSMSRQRLAELNDIILSTLYPVAVNKRAVSSMNPTVKEVLDTGRIMMLLN